MTFHYFLKIHNHKILTYYITFFERLIIRNNVNKLWNRFFLFFNNKFHATTDSLRFPAYLDILVDAYKYLLKWTIVCFTRNLPIVWWIIFNTHTSRESGYCTRTRLQRVVKLNIHTYTNLRKNVHNLHTYIHMYILWNDLLIVI